MVLETIIHICYSNKITNNSDTNTYSMKLLSVHLSNQVVVSSSNDEMWTSLPWI